MPQDLSGPWRLWCASSELEALHKRSGLGEPDTSTSGSAQVGRAVDCVSANDLRRCTQLTLAGPRTAPGLDTCADRFAGTALTLLAAEAA